MRFFRTTFFSRYPGMTKKRKRFHAISLWYFFLLWLVFYWDDCWLSTLDPCMATFATNCIKLDVCAWTSKWNFIELYAAIQTILPWYTLLIGTLRRFGFDTLRNGALILYRIYIYTAIMGVLQLAILVAGGHLPSPGTIYGRDSSEQRD
jgi:hypothetical protein